MAPKKPDKRRPPATAAARKAQAVALVASGVRVADAAQTVGLTRQTVSEWTNGGEGREQLRQASQAIMQRAVDEASSKLASVAVEAVSVLVEAMREAPMYADRIRAATYLCDRTLGKPQSRVEVDGQVTTGTVEAFETLPTKELARRLLAVIDVSGEEGDK